MVSPLNLPLQANPPAGVPHRDSYEKRPVLSATIHPDIKRTVASERTGMSVSQMTDEVLYTGLVEMHELPDLSE